MEISERTLREVFLPPWVAGIREAGARGVMATYPAIDGVPAHASVELLTNILRDELSFEGLVLGEGGGIATLIYEGLAADQKEAGQIAIRAGLDVGISYEAGFMGPLVESVREGRFPWRISTGRSDGCSGRSSCSGLFEQPYVDPERAAAVGHAKEHQDLALEAARESIVLLKNEGVLPLRKDVQLHRSHRPERG